MCISRLELHYGSSTLVPEGGEGVHEGGLSYVDVPQDLDQSLEEPKASGANEGKPKSITHLFNLSYYLCYVCAFTFQELNWNHRCIILGTYAHLLVF